MPERHERKLRSKHPLNRYGRDMGTRGSSVASESEADPKPEVVIGITCAIGVDTQPVLAQIYQFAGRISYHVIKIRVSDLMDRMPEVTFKQRRETDLAAYLAERMDAGDRLRAAHAQEVLALLACEEIHRSRAEITADSRGAIFIVDGLYHPSEVKLLRGVYGMAFFLIGVFDSEESRRHSLVQQIRSNHYRDQGAADNIVEGLLHRNEGSGSARHELSVSSTYHLADLFVSVVDPPQTRRSTIYEGMTLSEVTMRRFLEALFSSRNAVPNKYESGMAHAYVAARRSASLARQVGAAIVSEAGDVIATGYNEVPAPGGGQYPIPGRGESDILDQREFQFEPDADGRGLDTNDRIKWELVSDLIEKLQEIDALDLGTRSVTQVIEELDSDRLRPAILDVISYTRCVHAEMAALMSAARRGVPVLNATMYCTTFPCHECARHIVAAGLGEVIYIEPYPKSRVKELFHDSIAVNQSGGKSRVSFVPFVGVSPNRHDDLFAFLRRKHSSVASDDRGRAIEPAELPDAWHAAAAPRFSQEFFAAMTVWSAARSGEEIASGILASYRTTIEELSGGPETLGHEGSIEECQ